MADFTTNGSGAMSWSAGSRWTNTTESSTGAVPGPGDTATIAAGHTVTLDQDVTDLAGLTLNSELTWGSLGKTLRLAGNLTQNYGGVLTGGPGGVLEFDNAGRVWTTVPGWGEPYCTIRTIGTSEAARFTVRTDPGGVNARHVNQSGYDAGHWSLAHVDFLRFGDAANPAIQTAGPKSGDVFTWDDLVFDSCGPVTLTATTADAGFSFTRLVFRNSLGASTLTTAGAVNPTAPRLVDRCVFDRPPFLCGNGAAYTDNYFHRGFGNSYSTAPWASFDGNFVRQVQNNAHDLYGPMTNTVWLVDSDETPAVTGTATSGTTTTLTDSSRAWSDDAYSSNNPSMIVVLTGGTGAGQVRKIASNTATTLTIKGPQWAVTPDATTTYAIVSHVYNPHQAGVGKDVITDGVNPVLITDNAWFGTGVDGDGECLSDARVATAEYHVLRNLFLRNAGLNSPGDIASLYDQCGKLTIEHNTFFSGDQALIQHSEGANTPAGSIRSLRSNIAWCDPSQTASRGIYGPRIIADVLHYGDPAAGTLDVVAPGMADYNAGYGLASGNAGEGYESNFSVAPGAHDLFSTDPGFANVNATPLAWAIDQGATSSESPLDQAAALLAWIQADPTRTRLGLLPYLRAAMTPTNATLATAAHDGTTMGAVAIASVPATPTAPSDLTATVIGSSQIDLAWTDNSGDETEFVIERSLDGSTGWTQIATPTANTTTYSDAGLSAATPYYYRIKAANDAGSSIYSTTATAPTEAASGDLSDVNSPTNLQAFSPSDFEVFLTWDRANDAETAVLVERSGDGGSTWNTVATLPAGENLWFDRSLWPGTDYSWRVKVRTDAGDSDPSAVAAATTMTSADFRTSQGGLASPASATGVSVANLDCWTNRLDWTDPNPTNQGWWNIDRSTDGGRTYRTVAMAPNVNGASFWIDRYLQPGVTYQYRMRMDSAGYGLGDLLGPFTASTPALGTLPDAPTGLCANTYRLDLGSPAAGTFVLSITDGRHGSFTAATGSLPFDASAAAIQAALQTLCDAWTNDRNLPASVIVSGPAGGPFLVGFDDGALLLGGDGSGLTGGTLTVAERQTATNTTLLWEDQTGGAAAYKIEVCTNPFLSNLNYDDPGQWNQVGVTAAGATSFDLTTTAESFYFVRVRPTTAAGDGGYRTPLAVRTPSAGSALTLTVGPGEAYTSLGAVPWDTVGPGSVLSVAHGTYNELVMIGVRGTLSQPIVIQGIRSGENRPVLSGVNATTNPQFKTGVYDGYGVLMVLNRNLGTGNYGTTASFGWSAGNLLIKDLELTGAYRGDAGGLTFTSSQGVTLAYDYAAAGLYCAGGENLYFDGLYVHGNGNGIFGLKGPSGNDTLGDSIGTPGRNVVVRNCEVKLNGNPGHPYEHEVYFETDGLLAEGNRFGPAYGGGNAFKERASSLVFRYNVVNGSGPGAHLLDLIEPENHRGLFVTLPDAQKEDWVYGNSIYNPPITATGTSYGSGSPIHVGGDRGGYTGYKRLVRWYANTYLIRRDQNQPDSYWSKVFWGVDQGYGMTTRAAIDARRNIFHAIPDQTATVSPLVFFTDWGVGYFDRNFAATGWDSGISNGHVAGLNRLISGSDPGFADLASDPPDLSLTADSACIDQGVGSLARITIDRQPAALTTVARSAVGSAPDLGAFEFLDPNEPPPDEPPPDEPPPDAPRCRRPSKLVLWRPRPGRR